MKLLLTSLLIIILIPIANAQITEFHFDSDKFLNRIFNKLDFEAEVGISSNFYNQADDEKEDYQFIIPLLGANYEVDKNFKLGITSLYEDEEFSVETIYIDYTPSSHITFSVGLLTESLAHDQKNIVEDSFIEQISFTNEKMFRIEGSYTNLTGSFYIFNGDADRSGENDSIKSWGGKVIYSLKSNDYSLHSSYNYQNNIADSQVFSVFFKEAPLKRIIDAHSCSLGGRYKRTGIQLQYLQSGDYFRKEDLGVRDDIKLFDIRLFQEITINGQEAHLTASYQTTHGLANLDFPNRRFSLGSSFTLGKNITTGIEMFHDTHYRQSYLDTWKNLKYKTDQYLGGVFELVATI